MDPKAPRTATATLVLGMITWILCLVSFVLKLGFSNGFGTEEIILLIIGGLLFVTSFLASRERTEILMLEPMTVEEQFAAMESMPSTTTSSYTEVDQFGFETKPLVSSDTHGIVASILGPSESVNPEEINSAIAALSSGDPSSIGAESVRNNPAPHAHTEQFREVFKSSSTTQDGFERMKVENIPLPGEKEVRSTPDLPWLTPVHEFQTSGVAHIPLPGASQPAADIESLQVAVPGMPDLDDLFADDNQQTMEEPKIPALPNLDDLF
jgi:hypothetical protein